MNLIIITNKPHLQHQPTPHHHIVVTLKRKKKKKKQVTFC